MRRLRIITRSLFTLGIVPALAMAQPLRDDGPLLRWIATAGNPTAPCFAGVYEINVGEDFSLNSLSQDRKVSWAVSANERGLEVAACIDGPSGTDINAISWSVLKKRGRTRAVGDALVAVTHELVLRHKEVTIARSEEYRQDVEQLRQQLPRHLETLVRQEANRYPAFLEKELPINIPVS